ncbi:MAG: dihydrofolate reductase, partial [Clostridia bacterium]|nr:dihydrofolate reductase [Clostridia bacterium]
MTALIVAYDKNKLIGKDGKMPWFIDGELRRF